jgi:hypothetical protein
MCEYVIARRLCKKLILTRLMVGHTHEDIDAMFGVFWTKMQKKSILTAKEYSTYLLSSLYNNVELNPMKKFVLVKDIFVIPDYVKYFDGCIDPEFGRYAKTDVTQLQFIFEAVAPSDQFPLGCKTTYRAYSCDESMEIYDDPLEPYVKMNYRQALVSTFPRREDNYTNNSDGTYII